MSASATRRRILIEALAFTLVAAAATTLILHGQPSWVRHNRGLLIAAVWLYLPLLIAWQERIPLSSLGLGRPPLGQSLMLVLFWVLVSYPPFYLVWGLVQLRYLGRTFHLEWPPAFGNVILVQFLAIALPEEVFFRGYLQDRLNHVFGRPWRLWGAELGPGLFLTALLFMLCHLLLAVNWVRVAIFFPALLFGWMRERTGSLLAPVLFHALSNLTFIAAQASFHFGP
ncbi:MAG: hypothetical protein A2V67_09950 [Deltaproteobacteria bacterium RBG_13_61_14]|nr:MAG: hypothetical protein A2V67_09950 [Deltaproteobacteria bacterium RBG_13_61_14]